MRPSLCCGFESASLEVDGEAFAFPIAIADRFWPFGAAKFGRDLGCGGGFAAGRGRGQRALGGRGQVFCGWVGHGRSLARGWVLYKAQRSLNKGG